MADKHLTPDDILDRMELSETGKELRKLKCPLRVAYGGINAGKTHFILQDIVAQCLGFQPEPDRINGKPNQLRVIIGAYDFSHVDTNILPLLKKVMYQAGCPWDNACYTKHLYTFPNKNDKVTIYFFTYTKQKGMYGYGTYNVVSDIYFFNDANYANFEHFRNVRIHCDNYGWLDFRPTKKFWFNDELLPKQDKFRLCYKGGLNDRGNRFLTQAQKDSLEPDKADPKTRRSYVEGHFNDVDDEIIFREWFVEKQQVSKSHIPAEAQIIARGLDWGGQSKKGRSKMALVALYQYKNGYLVDEELYEAESGSEQVANFLQKQKNVNQAPLIADLYNNREALDNIKRRTGCDVRLAAKSPGSVLQSIRFINDQQIWVTERSTNLQKERKGYEWLDNNGRPNFKLRPNSQSDHDLLDAMRYAFEIARGLHEGTT